MHTRAQGLEVLNVLHWPEIMLSATVDTVDLASGRTLATGCDAAGVVATSYSPRIGRRIRSRRGAFPAGEAEGAADVELAAASNPASWSGSHLPGSRKPAHLAEEPSHEVVFGE